MGKCAGGLDDGGRDASKRMGRKIQIKENKVFKKNQVNKRENNEKKQCVSRKLTVGRTAMEEQQGQGT